MSFNIEELRDTLEFNRNEIMNNQLLTNEYMVEDIMKELGYNKRRNKDIKRLLDKPIDWEVLSTGSPRLAIKVFALGDNIGDEAIQEVVNYCKERIFSILIITNGEIITVYRYNKVKRDYAKVCDISLLEDLDDNKNTVLEAISNDGFDMSVIDDLLSKLEVSPEKVKNVLKDNVGVLASQVATWLGDSSDTMIGQCKVVISDLISSENISGNNASDENTNIENETNTPDNNIDVTEYTNKIDELQNNITELETKLAETDEELTNKDNQLTEANNKIAELSDKITAIEENNTSDSETASDSLDTSKLEEEIDSLKEEIKGKDETINSLNESITDSQNKLAEEKSKIEETNAKLLETENQLSEANNKLAEAESRANESEAKLLELENESSGTIMNAEVQEKLGNMSNQEEIDAYRKQIQDLSNKLAEAEATIDSLKSKLEKAEDSINDMAGADRRKALELLGVIEDSKELPRSYVAVINTELLQYDKLETFAGRTIQKLYEIKSTEASQYLFNADMFKLVQPATNNDLIMNNKAYDIELGNIPEDEVLNKLRILFSHFSDVIFECKKIGSTDVKEADIQSNSIYSNKTVANTANNSENTEQFDDNDNDSFEGSFGNNFESSFGNADDFGDSASDNESDNFENSSFGNENNGLNLHGIMCAQMLQLDDLMWDTEVQFNTIKYIGSSSMNFNVNMNCDNISNEQLLCRGLDAVLALAVLMGNTRVLSLLRQIDLSQVNNFIQLYTEEYAGYPRINGTRYAVAGIESVTQVATVLVDLANALHIDMSDIFIFFDTDTSSQQLLDTWGYEEAAIQLREYTDLQVPDEADAVAVLKGNIFSNIIVTKNSLQAHKAIFKKTLAVKTNYLAKIINADSDFAEVIGEIVAEAIKSGKSINFNSIGNVIGESYKLVSDNASEVKADCEQIDVDGNILYVSNVENWQMPLSVIKVHTALLANTSIAVKVNINSQALRFYLEEFTVAEPSLSLAVSSFSKYVASCIK